MAVVVVVIAAEAAVAAATIVAAAAAVVTGVTDTNSNFSSNLLVFILLFQASCYCLPGKVLFFDRYDCRRTSNCTYVRQIKSSPWLVRSDPGYSVCCAEGPGLGFFRITDIRFGDSADLAIFQTDLDSPGVMGC